MGEMPEMEPPKEEEVTMKSIQKLTGKLAQKIRAFASNEENEMTSNDIKYVVNSILSAFDLSMLDEEDREEIMSKFEPEEDMDGEDEMAPEGEDMGTGEAPEMPAPEAGGLTEPPTGEMAEYYPPHRRGARFNKPMEMGERIERMYSESKVDKVLDGYFGQINEQQKIIAKKLKEKYPKAKFYGKSVTNNLIYEMNDKKIFIKPNGKIVKCF
jgi:hypothetical protein